MSMPSFPVGLREVGGDAPAFIVAEIGANHDGDVGVARELIEMAAEAGADAVKLQTYTADELLADPHRIVTWGPEDDRRSEPIGAMFDRLALPREEHMGLFQHAAKLGLPAFSTPFSPDGARFLAELDVPLVKIASSDLSWLELLDAAAEGDAPVIVSTGMATLAEADVAVRRLLSHRPAGVAVLHCVTSYPAPHEELNLRAIPALAAVFPECVIGFSDHSTGTTAAIGAVALGAKIIEKHVTLDPARPGPDHWFSAGPDELATLVTSVRELEAALGTGAKRVQPSERDDRKVAHRSLHTTGPVPAGSPLEDGHLRAARPGTGLHPFELPNVLGLRPTRDLPAGHPLSWDDFR
jgi:N,N'-diacetyllegionaminate synthase